MTKLFLIAVVLVGLLFVLVVVSGAAAQVLSSPAVQGGLRLLGK